MPGLSSSPRMLVLDLDGTTLTDDRTLTRRDIEAAHALRAQGVTVTIATGRLFTGTRWVAQALGVRGPVAVMNGSELVDVDTGAARHGCYMPPRERLRIREVLANGGLSTFLFGSRRIHYGEADAHRRSYLEIWTEDHECHPDVFQAPQWERGDDILAICALGHAGAVSQSQDALRSALGDTVVAEGFDTLTGERFLNLRCDAEDKGSALERMASVHGLRAEDAVAVGDWLNDLPMLRRAGRSYAMRGSIDEVCGAADEVLDAGRGQGGAVAEIAARVWGVEV